MSVRKQGSSDHGYTLVEVMLTSVITIAGFAALMNVQVASLDGVTQARDQTVALTMAEHFAESVRMWSARCPVNDGSPACEVLPLASDTAGAWAVWEAPTSTGGVEMVAPGGAEALVEGDPDFGIATELGVDALRRYCVHYRTAWIQEPRLFRVDVRVLYPRDDTDMTMFTSCDLELFDPGASVVQVGSVSTSRAIYREVVQ
jgi:type II secretory pathway pseudopilin PulG